ncbi:hypothetical protein BDN70DRAFT_881387 [Pholiota conissans]|uniref:Uncharacterized protein n=1 Tax=Pholiota conissans TaxID=109636 RepID=A0A9P6CRQ3_9AGAR|nr:hypothetical protein BDN70DRAFT_881387 [Pholiota conissans]
MTRPSPTPQNIHVILNPNDGEDLYIDIPYAEVQRLSLSPSRLLNYFCFIVLGLPGILHLADGRRVSLEREEDGSGFNIEAGGPYIYHVEGDTPFTSTLVDPEAVREVGSQITTSSQGDLPIFRSRLDARDKFGIFTGGNSLYCQSQHIIAHGKGDFIISYTYLSNHALSDIFHRHLTGTSIVVTFLWPWLITYHPAARLLPIVDSP